MATTSLPPITTFHLQYSHLYICILFAGITLLEPKALLLRLKVGGQGTILRMGCFASVYHCPPQTQTPNRFAHSSKKGNDVDEIILIDFALCWCWRRVIYQKFYKGCQVTLRCARMQRIYLLHTKRSAIWVMILFYSYCTWGGPLTNAVTTPPVRHQ